MIYPGKLFTSGITSPSFKSFCLRTNKKSQGDIPVCTICGST